MWDRFNVTGRISVASGTAVLAVILTVVGIFFSRADQAHTRRLEAKEELRKQNEEREKNERERPYISAVSATQLKAPFAIKAAPIALEFSNEGLGSAEDISIHIPEDNDALLHKINDSNEHLRSLAAGQLFHTELLFSLNSLKVAPLKIEGTIAYRSRILDKNFVAPWCFEAAAAFDMKMPMKFVGIRYLLCNSKSKL